MEAATEPPPSRLSAALREGDLGGPRPGAVGARHAHIHTVNRRRLLLALIAIETRGYGESRHRVRRPGAEPA